MRMKDKIKREAFMNLSIETRSAIEKKSVKSISLAWLSFIVNA